MSFLHRRVLSVCVLAVIAVVGSSGLTAASARVLPLDVSGRALTPTPPPPGFMVSCVLKGALSHDCTSQTVAAIEQARRSEGVRRSELTLPRNYTSLTRAERAFVVIDLERVARGLRPIKGMVKRLNKAAKSAAVAQTDPTPGTSLLQGLGVRRYQVLWANDYGVLASDWEWMYNDGFLGKLTTNVGCLFRGASDCWAHRNGILQPFTGLPLLLAGTGSARAGAGATSVTAILTGGYGKKPHCTYTWRQAVAHGAGDHSRG